MRHRFESDIPHIYRNSETDITIDYESISPSSILGFGVLTLEAQLDVQVASIH